MRNDSLEQELWPDCPTSDDPDEDLHQTDRRILTGERRGNQGLKAVLEVRFTDDPAQPERAVLT